jgi:hypothetical protein
MIQTLDMSTSAREDREGELAGDMRVAFGVLRSHAKGVEKKAKKKR